MKTKRLHVCLNSTNRNARYGGNAKAFVPQIQEVHRALVQEEPKKGPKSESLTAVEKCLSAIEADANPPPLVNLKDFSAAPPTERNKQSRGR